MKLPFSLHLKALNIYLETGNLSEVSRKMGIDRRTLFRWKIKEGWDKIVKDRQIEALKTGGFSHGISESGAEEG